MVMRLLRTVAAQGVSVVMVLHDINLAGTYADQVLQPQLVQRI